jgi:hypothetical protein
MVDLVIVIPTHNRPDAAPPLVDIFAATCKAGTALAFAVDESDPTALRYAEALSLPLVDVRYAAADDWASFVERRVGVFQTPSTAMVQALNTVGVAVVDNVKPFAVGFMGDDNRPRTAGWDSRFLAELRQLGSGIVYGNDLLQGRNLPTQMAMTSDIVRTLGWLGPPTLTHLYVDNFWRDFGLRAECLRYLDDVVIEHLHPLAGKSVVDTGYQRVNSPDSYRSGDAAYRAYVAEHLDADVARVRALRGVRT